MPQTPSKLLHFTHLNRYQMTLQMTSGMAGMSVNDKKGHGTIKAPASIDPEADAGVLRKAMKGMGEYTWC